MKIKRSFIDGTMEVENLKGTDSLLLNQISIANSPRAFQVKALPSHDVVYWSFSRRKANSYIESMVSKYGFNVEFGETVQSKSLDYSFRYSPNEYMLGTVIYALLGVALGVSVGAEIIFTALLLLLSMLCLWRCISSRKPYNKSLKGDAKKRAL
jgi:hypothetical protein